MCGGGKPQGNPFPGPVGGGPSGTNPDAPSPGNPGSGGPDTGGTLTPPTPGDFLPKPKPNDGMPAPESDAPVAPVADPKPNMEDPDPTETAAQKLKRLKALRAGLASTTKTSSQGTTTPPLVSMPGLYSTGTKGKLGQ